SQLPVDEKGLRGAVLLQPGRYVLSGSLKLHTSGVVLRGSGFTENGTVLIGEGTTRETLIRIAGQSDIVREKKGRVEDAYVPVNAHAFRVDNVGDLRPGDRILITRPSRDEWSRSEERRVGQGRGLR